MGEFGSIIAFISYKYEVGISDETVQNLGITILYEGTMSLGASRQLSAHAHVLPY